MSEVGRGKGSWANPSFNKLAEYALSRYCEYAVAVADELIRYSSSPCSHAPCEAPNPPRRRAGWLWRIGAQDSRMLQRRARQPPRSRYSNSELQTHLRELGAQSSHGRPARSPTKPAWSQLPYAEPAKRPASPTGSQPNSVSRRSIRIPRQLPVQHAHHGFKIKPLALFARMQDQRAADLQACMMHARSTVGCLSMGHIQVRYEMIRRCQSK